MRQTHVNNKMRKEDIFRQLDSFSDRGGDIIKAEFMAYLCNIGALTEREAIDLTTEYIKRCKKLERNRH
ncbi:hypothetical protein [Haemophilus haemolyticus]|uniref:hypothetical protein n=1 Tax=Haemophilus haemolyticus TaxID=726 RepID=UPI00062D3A72|nr:hypothetical protein [Haemophilus haemolyticus]KKZ56479.1 hypothetical protein AAX16_01640 [Haemophilus haemolyticus]DAR28811.1 MAG TPA: Primase X [Caudoviricetes sp.]